jgi:hypothetical protein
MPRMTPDRQRPAASWLRSDDTARWAAAMVRCQCPEPRYCAEDERCRYDGACFRRQRPDRTTDERLDALEARVAALERATAERTRTIKRVRCDTRWTPGVRGGGAPVAGRTVRYDRHG